MSNNPAQQLPLLIPSDPAYDAAGFLADASNEEARTWLDRPAIWPDRRLALWGEADRGKTHLVRIWAARTGAEIFHGPALSGFPEVTSLSGAAVDDADEAGEAALLHLLNTARDMGSPILLAARTPPARWPVTLRDLASRLRAITAVEIGPPDDDLLRRLLFHWLAEQRLVADETLHNWMLAHLPRSPQVLRAAVLRLDHDALKSRRRTVTLPMLRAALAADRHDDESRIFSTQVPSPMKG
jgi:chromosomal replication initiation ATPase DnaA